MPDSRKPNAPRHADRRLLHQAVIGSEYLKGRLQVEIAKDLGISVTTVKRDLKAIRHHWLESSLRDFNSLKAEQLAKIDTIEAESWAMWKRSCETRLRTSEQNIEAAKFPGRNRKTDQAPGKGEPRYLQTALICIERRCKLLGLNSPEKIDVTDSEKASKETACSQDVRTMSDHELESRIDELERKRTDEMTDEQIKLKVLDMTRSRFNAI